MVITRWRIARTQIAKAAFSQTVELLPYITGGWLSPNPYIDRITGRKLGVTRKKRSVGIIYAFTFRTYYIDAKNLTKVGLFTVESRRRKSIRFSSLDLGTEIGIIWKSYILSSL